MQIIFHTVKPQPEWTEKDFLSVIDECKNQISNLQNRTFWRKFLDLFKGIPWNWNITTIYKFFPDSSINK